MIDSRLWEILITFHQHGSLSAAAEQLYVSQPTLSAAMQKLEKERCRCQTKYLAVVVQSGSGGTAVSRAGIAV